MAIHLRQICLVAGQLGPAIAALREVLDLPVAHVDPAVGKFGLENTLLTIGTQFLEVVAPLRDGTAAGRYLDRRGGDGGYMVICQVPERAEQEALRVRAADAGVREAHYSDRGDWTLCQLHPGDMGASFLEVDWDARGDVTGTWMPAGGLDWQQDVPAQAAITGVTLQGPEPEALGRHWAQVLGLPLERAQGAPAIMLGNARLRFEPARDGRGPGLSALDIALPDPAAALARADASGLRDGDTALICGTRFRLGRANP